MQPKPTLKNLPPPPPEKTGWPWTEEAEPLADLMPNSSEWPRISIVTPSYNYGHFIEETIRSVLLQGYPNLEYIIIDGGSQDNTVEIIKKYEKFLTYWMSEPDEGQTDAINKGYKYCTGDIFAWLNADDSYSKITLGRVAENYLNGYQLIAGSCLAIYNDGNKQIFNSVPTKFEKLIRFWVSGANFTQPSVFVDKKIADHCFPLDKSLYMLMDYEFFLRFMSYEPKSIYIQETWVIFKFHGANKTLSNYPHGMNEFFKISLSESVKLPFLKRLKFLMALKDYQVFYPIVQDISSANLSQLSLALIARPTLLSWPLFWKVLLQMIIGRNLYFALKKAKFTWRPKN